MVSTLALLSMALPPFNIIIVFVRSVLVIASAGAVALVTLRRGAAEGVYVLACASIAVALLGFFLIGNFTFALLYMLAQWLPIWLIAIVLREGRQLSLAVEIAVFIGMLGVAGFYLYESNPSLMWENLLNQMAPKNIPEDVQKTVTAMAHYMTGFLAFGVVLVLLFGLFLGRWWQSALYNPGGFKQEFLLINTSQRLAVVSLLVLVVALLNLGAISEIAGNMAILLFLLYTLIGTSVMHTVFSAMKMGRYLVPMFYITLLLIPQVMMPVALVGLCDAWLNIRKKNSNQTRA